MNRQKIEDLYVIYSLCKNIEFSISELKKYTKITISTINKYLSIQEKLDIRLFPYLDNKKHKLSLGMAYELSKQFLNPDTQYKIFMKHLKKKNNENKLIISNIKTCNICCEDSVYIGILPCCKNFICEKCLTDTILMYLTDISFKIALCPFCKKVFKMKFLEEILSNRFIKNYNSWIDTNFKRYINYKHKYFYNLLNRYTSIYDKIVQEKALQNIRIRKIKHLPRIIAKEIYGFCKMCTPEINSNFRYTNIKIKSIEKRCVNDQNQLLVIKPEMFTCHDCQNVVCEIKKCPHCGIKTIKPENCNFISRCKCRQSWCFVCSSRLPNDNNGHNQHYYLIGGGNSAYDPKCRVTENHNGPTHVIEKCKCSFCIKRNFKPICLDLNCNHPASNWKAKYCYIHRTERYHRLGRGIPLPGEPELNIHNI